MAGVVAASVAVPFVGWSWRPVELPLVVLALLLTLPHGAADAAAPWLRSRRLRPGLLASSGIAYAGLATLTWLVARAHPVGGIALLLGLSVAHFGAGESSFLRASFLRAGGIRLPRGWSLVAGLGVVVLPLAAHPAQAGAWLAEVVPAWRRRPPWGLAPGVFHVAALLLAVAVTCAVLAYAARAACGPARAAALELVLLTACALLAPPVVTIAVFLAAWHSPRHLALLGRDAARAGLPRLPLVVAAVLASGLALLALVLLVRAQGGADAPGVLRQQVWLLTALTVPHALVVSWLDHTRGGGPHSAEESSRVGA